MSWLADGALIVHLLVPLCSNAQVACGSPLAGRPDDLAHNLYWGAVFGHMTFATRRASPFALVDRAGAEGDRLARVVVRRVVPGEPWQRDQPAEVVVVLDAFHGDAIDGVVDRFFVEAERGATVDWNDGERERRAPVDVVGFAGHNRMMDGKAAPPPGPPGLARPIASFVLACDSAATFAAPLRERGSTPLLLTRSLMAPEGYVLEALVVGLAGNEDRGGLRRRAGRAYARWQSIDEAAGRSIFADLR